VPNGSESVVRICRGHIIAAGEQIEGGGEEAAGDAWFVGKLGTWGRLGRLGGQLLGCYKKLVSFSRCTLVFFLFLPFFRSVHP
jgi:hypothetical protein